MRKIFPCFAGVFAGIPPEAIDRRHWHPASTPKLRDEIPGTIEISGNKKRPMMPVLDDATISAQLSEPNHNSVMKPEVTALCPICNFP
jgi:hypothetical protein